MLGIGLTPNYNLDVNGNIRSSSNLMIKDGVSTDPLNFISALNNQITSFNSCSFNLGQSYTTNNCTQISYYHAGNGSSSNYIGLGFYNSGTQFCVTAGGTIGINKTNPTFNLDIAGNQRISGPLVQNNVVQWRYNFNTNTGGTATNGGPITWSHSNFGYSTWGNINTTNNLLTSTGVPTTTNAPSPIMTFPFSGIYSLNIQVRYANSASENAVWFAPFQSSTYNETASNNNSSRLAYISNGSYNTPTHYTGYFAAGDTCAIGAFSFGTNNSLINGFGNGLTVQLIQRSA
ncbi:MAG: hypothetical protein EOP34_04440 [Rickettsiales bacterium]|nr:MAG: hypothetical protein EOP34_04440 [Rickettsiales bacterium]